MNSDKIFTMLTFEFHEKITLSSYRMRKYVPEVKETILGDDPESVQIRGFFVNGDATTLTEMKWTAPLFD